MILISLQQPRTLRAALCYTMRKNGVALMESIAKCGKWTLLREIGRGAYGIVYLAKDATGASAAVKVCARDDDERYERELRGAKLYRTIPPSAGLVRMLDLGECEWGFYFAMELADDEFGGSSAEVSVYRPKTLACVISGEKALPLESALQLGFALTDGLITLQRHHLLHRDVKPGNVVYVHGCPVLADPGLLVEEAEAVSRVGTPGYVPPENFTGAGGDVYSLGLTLKSATFGRSVENLAMGPTLEADTDDVMFPVWWRILNKATHPDAARRYRSAKALRNDLLSLQRKKRLWKKTLGLPRFVWYIVIMLTVVIGVVAYKAKSEVDYSTARWRQLDEQIQRQKEMALRQQEILLKNVDKMVEDFKRTTSKSGSNRVERTRK